MWCTIYVCLFIITYVKTDVPLPHLPDDGSCILGKSYQDGCHICECFGEKALLCKKIEGCIEEHNKHITTGHAQICKIGDRKHGRPGDCNICDCTQGKNGINEWTCHENNCSARRHKRGAIADLKNTPCAPNDSFTLDCNTCYCNSAKSGYRCTEHICAQDNSTEILIAQNTTLHDFLKLPSVLVEGTAAASSSETSSTTPLSTIKLVETTSSLDGGNQTTVAHIEAKIPGTTPKSARNNTNEDSVLSLG